MRLVPHQAWLHFFNVDRRCDHVIRPVERYHWNNLSLDRLCEAISGLGGEIEIIPVSSFLQDRFDGYEHYNPNTFTLLVTKN